LKDAGITVNKNTQYRMTLRKPNVTSGIRLGTPAVTSRGMKEQEMEKIADLIDEALDCRGKTSLSV
jgi:glycine hydroxymethyltransferase